MRLPYEQSVAASRTLSEHKWGEGVEGEPELGPGSSPDQTGSPVAHQQTQIRCGSDRVVCHHCAEFDCNQPCVCRQLLDVQLHGSQGFSSRGRLQAAAWETYAAVTVVCVSDRSLQLLPECAQSSSSHVPDMHPHPQADMANDGGLQRALASHSASPGMSLLGGVTSLKCDSEGALCLSCASFTKSGQDAEIFLHDIRDIERQLT